MRFGLFALCILAAAPAAQAQDLARDFCAPRIERATVDWAATRADLPEGANLDTLNTAVTERFAAVASSPVPVLLPFDVKRYLRDRDASSAQPTEDYLSGFRPAGFFHVGPSGYEALFELRERDGIARLRFRNPIFVSIAGFGLTYDVPPPNGIVEARARETDEPFPGLRRLILESNVRYAFTRYGVPYVVTIQCFDRAPAARRLSCRQADAIAERFLDALSLAGGNPRDIKAPPAQATIARPQKVSPDFTFFAPGKLLPGTGMKGRDGVVDYTVYSSIRFPLAETPAFANSQSFMHWGDCDHTGRAPSPRGRKDFAYRCRVNSKLLTFNEGARENYAYPWRDNFCEHRFFYVGRCGAGLGHQGQDIRPSACKQRNEGADRCRPEQDGVVAARAGMILRAPKQESFFLVSNGENELVRFRYMHMHPDRLDEDNVLSGRVVKEGEALGHVGNYNRRNNGTTTHLHFEVQVPTRDGWVRVNPYVSLVAAYERLLGARGTEIADEPSAANAPEQGGAAHASGEAPTAR